MSEGQGAGLASVVNKDGWGVFWRGRSVVGSASLKDVRV